MGLLNLFESKGEVPAETKSAPGQYVTLGDITQGGYSEWIVNGEQSLAPHQAARIYRTSSAVAIAVDTIGDEVQKIKPVLEINGKKVDNSPVLDLLATPNPWQTRQQFLGSLVRDWLLNHDCFVAAVGNVKAEPAAIYTIPPQRVGLSTMSTDEMPTRYNVSSGLVRGNFNRELEKRLIRFQDGPLKELHHIRGYSSRPGSAWSDSPLEAALLEAKQQIQGRYHNLKLLQNGARLSLIAVFKHPLQEDEVAARRQGLNEQLGGAANTGKIAVVSSDEMELNEVGINNKDMDFAKLDAVVFKTLMIRYKIPLPIVSDNAMTDNNFGEAVFQLYDRAVLPAFEYMMNDLGHFILPRYKLDPAHVRITYDPQSIEALKQRTLENLLKRRELNIESVNEMREDLPNRNPVEGGEDIYQAATLVPIGESMLSEDNLNEDEQESSTEDE